MATIEFDPEDYLDEVEVQQLLDELANRDVNIPRPFGDGDPLDSRFVEAAFHAARAMPDCPPAIKDLFWHVYGRAIA